MVHLKCIFNSIHSGFRVRQICNLLYKCYQWSVFKITSCIIMNADNLGMTVEFDMNN